MSRWFALLLTFLLAAANSFSFAQPPKPVLTCISVSSPVSIIAYWETPTLSGSYDGFRLFYKKIGASVSNSIDISDIGATSTTVNIPDISTAKYEFFLTTLKNGITSEPSATVQNILLDVAGLGTGIARLEWNNASPSGAYHVTRSINNVDFVSYKTLVSNEPLVKYNDTINGICAVTEFFYRIESVDCNNAFSNVDAATLRDQDLPNDPHINLITVKNDGADNFYTEIQWEHSTSYDVNHYLVYLVEGTGTLVGNAGFNKSYIIDDPSHPAYVSPCSAPLKYIVRAVDNCNNGSSGAINYQNPQNTIYLKGDISTYCERKAYLEWNAYENMVPPVKDYLVERSDGGPFITVGSIPAIDTLQLYQFLDDNMLEPGMEARYRIAAVASDGTKRSHSCEFIATPFPILVDALDITSTSVSESGTVLITITASPADAPVKMALYRTTGEGYIALDTVSWDPSGVMVIEDTEAETNKESYTYYAVALDACENGVAYSSEFNTILLKLKAEGERMELTWNDHNGWGNAFNEYLVYKFINSEPFDGYPIHTNATSYVEFDNSDTFEEVTYIVEAVNRNSEIPSSRSNVELIPKPGAIQVPTAFKPGSGISKNGTFKPDVRNVDPSTYLFRIYNKWGERIFESTNKEQGWDGTFNGQILSGVFIWTVTYRDQQGNTDVHRGNVVIVR